MDARTLREPVRAVSDTGRLPRRPRLGRPRLLIVGCGYTGSAIVARLSERFRIFATTATGESADRIRAAGAIPLLLDLDHPAGKNRIAGLAPSAIVLAPTSGAGTRDARSARLLAALLRPHLAHSGANSRAKSGARLVYVSTSGVYGDRAGAWTEESMPATPANDRAWRRLDAERRLRACPWHACVLRAPGIYGPGRLPIDRLRQGLPVPPVAQDIYTNHIHVQDLARACIAALFRAAPSRVYNVVDDSQLLLGQYLDKVADAHSLARPPRAPWETVREAAGPQRMSFLSESRRLRNTRMKRELRLRLRFADVDAGLAAQASNSLSTER